MLAVVLEESSIQHRLIGLPLYIDTMIAFAAVTLPKVTARWKGVRCSSGWHGDGAIEGETSRVATYHRASICRPRKNVD